MESDKSDIGFVGAWSYVVSPSTFSAAMLLFSCSEEDSYHNVCSFVPIILFTELQI
jgi:hypothetical protein